MDVNKSERLISQNLIPKLMCKCVHPPSQSEIVLSVGIELNK